MVNVAIAEKTRGKAAARDYSFTVLFEPLTQMVTRRRNGRIVRRAQNPSWPGYQVTVPMLPGLITYGRTLDEAREMARDAIRCHLEGLQKDGERIPDERSALKEKLRVVISA
ncbi:MAG TPA: type II toxin-antitoxin system HicB family antitoxin [Candidatus Solibacter sp.]|nr:type II toxin-antitoxin system HicB family antitoxin [Candidatus Solibacter sp.]